MKNAVQKTVGKKRKGFMLIELLMVVGGRSALCKAWKLSSSE